MSYDDLWQETADALGLSVEDLMTIASYETGGTFNPMQAGPTTKWGQHRGLIQFGEPQAKRYGVDFSSPDAAMRSQLGADGAIVQYMLGSGYEPGMGFMDAYSTINAGGPGRYGASDAAAGGAPGTVADKVNNQMAGHRANAQRRLGLGSDLPSGAPRGKSGGLSANTRMAGLMDDEEPTKFDTFRSNLQSGTRNALGLNEKQASGVGRGLSYLGSQLLQG